MEKEEDRGDGIEWGCKEEGRGSESDASAISRTSMLAHKFTSDGQLQTVSFAQGSVKPPLLARTCMSMSLMLGACPSVPRCLPAHTSVKSYNAINVLYLMCCIIHTACIQCAVFYVLYLMC